jgi:formate dehydrogenase
MHVVKSRSTPSAVIPIAPMPPPRPLPLRHGPKGRTPSPQAREQVQALCEGLAPRRDLLIEHLHRLQDAEHGLRPSHLAALAERLRLSQAEVFEVASFYHHFRLLDEGAAPPTATVRVCTSLSCTMAGATDLHHQLVQACASEGIEVLEAPCIGRCHQAPAACVGQHEMGHATLERVVQALEHGHTEAVELPDAIGYAAYRKQGGYRLAQELHLGQRSAQQVLDELQASQLKGLGGAGFPAFRKWALVRAEAGPRHLVVNLDEGEVGTFKDGHLLATDPHRMLEGMLVACQVVGIDRVWIYLRDEYHAARQVLQRELALLQADPPIPAQAMPTIELRRGAGAYICGEESALIESVEGKRGLPRLRPPYVAQVGVFGRPTLAHNHETLSWVRDIAERGGAWFASHGRRGRTGLRRFSVSGRVQRPGVHLAPAGISVRELIDEFAGGMLPGHQLYAYLPGGASGGILPASLDHLPLDFDGGAPAGQETLASHGCFVGSMAVVVLSQHDRARDAALNLMRFFEHESCGQCTPCREGTGQAVGLMKQAVWNAELMDDLSFVMREASICGLGQAAPNPMDSVRRFFAHEVQQAQARS